MKWDFFLIISILSFTTYVYLHIYLFPEDIFNIEQAKLLNNWSANYGYMKDTIKKFIR